MVLLNVKPFSAARSWGVKSLAVSLALFPRAMMASTALLLGTLLRLPALAIPSPRTLMPKHCIRAVLGNSSTRSYDRAPLLAKRRSLN